MFRWVGDVFIGIRKFQEIEISGFSDILKSRIPELPKSKKCSFYPLPQHL
jgi:hypothetical protein